MRKYCFQENILSREDIQNIEELTSRVKEEENMIRANERKLEECKFCKTSRRTIKDCKKLIKDFMKELEDTYSIKKYLL